MEDLLGFDLSLECEVQFNTLICSNLSTEKAQKIYNYLLNELLRSVTESNDFDKFKISSQFMMVFLRIHYTYCMEENNPLQLTNLLILCCKFNRLQFLEFLLLGDLGAPFPILPLFVYNKNPLPTDTDNQHKTAFYYAMLNGNVKLIEMLIQFWENNPFDCNEKLESILAETYEELVLKNIDLSEEITMFMTKTLFDFRFKCLGLEEGVAESKNHNKNNDTVQLQQRIDFLLENLNTIITEYGQGKEFDQKLLFLCQTLAKDIYIVKQKVKSSYLVVPWEEIEFMVIAFVLCHTKRSNLNFFYSSVLRRGRFFKHLQIFGERLTAEKENINKNIFKPNKVPGSTLLVRSVHLEKLRKNDENIDQLIDDYETIRDAYSFRTIVDSIDLALSVDENDPNGALVVHRALQVIGEQLKNTWASPNLSSKSCEIILMCTPKTTIDHLIELRNSFSHGQSLVKRDNENAINDDHLKNIKNDLNKVKKIVTKVIGDKSADIISALLKQIIDCKTVKEFADIADIFASTETEYKEFAKIRGQEMNEIKVLLKKLDQTIRNKDETSSRYIQQIHELLPKATEGLSFIQNRHIQAFVIAERFKKEVSAIGINEKNIEDTKELVAKSFARFIKPPEHVDSLNDIACIAENLYHHFKIQLSCLNLMPALDDHDVKLGHYDLKTYDYMVTEAIFKIYLLCRSDSHEMKCTEDLKYEFCYKTVRKCSNKSSKQNNEHLLPKLFDRLQIELKEYHGSTLDHKTWTSFDGNKKLQATIQMIYLDIMSLLTTSEKFTLPINVHYLDDSCAFPFGREFRNYLAHHHPIINIRPIINPARCLLLNAVKLLDEYNAGTFDRYVKIVIGKKCKEDLLQFRAQFDRNVKVIEDQNNYFVAVQNEKSTYSEAANFNTADLNGRDINLQTALHFAAKNDNLVMIEGLLAAGLNSTKKDKNGYTPLHVSVDNNNLAVTKQLLAKLPIDINKLNARNGQTLLHIASIKCSAEMIRLLLQYKANDKAKFDEHLPVHLAIQSKNEYAARIFIEKLNDANSSQLSDFSLLHMTAEMGFFDIVKILLKKGAKIYARNEKLATPLHMACLGGSYDIIKYLLENGAAKMVNETNIEGFTPLHYSTKIGSPEVIEILLRYNADPCISDKLNGDTPLHLLCKNGHTEAVKILLSRCNIIDVNSKNYSYYTPMHYAAEVGHAETVELLIKNKALINCETDIKATPLYLAAKNGHLDIVKLLIENGDRVKLNLSELRNAPITAATVAGKLNIVEFFVSLATDISADVATYLLERAALTGHAGVVSYFLNKNAKITPVIYKAAAQTTSILNLFLKNGLDVNATDRNGNGVVHYASKLGNAEVMQLLIDNNVDVCLLTKKPHPTVTPINLAIQENKTKVVEILIKRGALQRENNKSKLVEMVIERQNFDILNNLLKTQTLSDDDKSAGLKIAVLLGSVEMVDLLLKHLQQEEALKSIGAQLLCCSACLEYTRISGMLLEKGVPVDSKLDRDQQTPLLLSVTRNSFKMVKFFIDNGANVNCATSVDGITPLIYACKFGYTEVAKLLVESGADVQLADQDQRTALEFATSTNKIECVQLLMGTKKFDVNKVAAFSKFTLLHIAAQEGNLEVTKFLGENGADMYAENLNGSKPIHLAAREGHTNIVEYYLEKGMSINEQASNRLSLMHFAAAANKLDMIRYLISHDADINLKGEQNFTPLDVAFQMNHSEAVELLLYFGAICTNRPSTFVMNAKSFGVISSTQKLFDCIKTADHREIERLVKLENAQLNAKNDKNFTILHYATWKGYLECVKVILANNGNPNIIGRDKSTPLHYAAKFDHFDIVQELLVHGAIFNIKSSNGKTAFQLATNEKIKNLLSSINNCFIGVKNKGRRFISDLSKNKNRHEVKAVVNARNDNSETIMLTAMKCEHPQLFDLLQLHQTVSAVELLKTFNELILAERYTEAVVSLWKARKERSEFFGKDCPGNLILDGLIADATYNQRKLHDALQLVNALYSKQKDIFGQNSKYALQTISTKSLILFRLGQTTKALNLIQKVEKEQKKMLKPSDEHYIVTQNTLGLIYQELRRFDEALEAYKRAFEGWKTSRGLNDQATLAAQNNVALVLGYMGQYEKSLKIFNDVYARRLKHLGPQHSDTLRTVHNISHVKTLQSKHDEALTTMEALLEKQIKTLGLNHVDTLKTKAEIGRILFEQKKLHLACKHFQEVLPKLFEKLGPDNHEYLGYKNIMEVIETSMFWSGMNNSMKVLKELNNDFIQAVQHNNVDDLKKLINDGRADVNARNSDGFTALHFAVKNNNKHIVHYLLNKSADPTLVSNKGNTPLHTAATMGHADLASLLLDHVQQNNLPSFFEFINAQTLNGKMTAVHVAAKQGSLETVETLLGHGAIFEMANCDGRKPKDLSTKNDITSLFVYCERLFEIAKLRDVQLLEHFFVAWPGNADKLIVCLKCRNRDNKTLLESSIASAEVANKVDGFLKKLMEYIN